MLWAPALGVGSSPGPPQILWTALAAGLYAPVQPADLPHLGGGGASGYDHLPQGPVEILLKWLASREWQVVITTYSLDVIYEPAYQEPEDVQAIVLRKGPDDVVHHKALDMEKLGKLVDTGLGLRRQAEVLEL